MPLNYFFLMGKRDVDLEIEGFISTVLVLLPYVSVELHRPIIRESGHIPATAGCTECHH